MTPTKMLEQIEKIVGDWEDDRLKSLDAMNQIVGVFIAAKREKLNSERKLQEKND